MTRRTERVASTIQQELALIIMRELQDPRLTGLPSITRVKVSADLSIADVFVTIMGSEGQQTAALNALKHAAGMLRMKLTKQLTLRVAPFLKFHIDENLKREMAVLQLLQKVRQETEEADRQRALAEGHVALADGGPAAIDSPVDSPVDSAVDSAVESQIDSGTDSALNSTTNPSTDLQE